MVFWGSVTARAPQSLFLFPGWFCVSAAWTAQPFDLDNYTSANCLCPATATGGKCTAGFYCPQGSPEPLPCPPGLFCNASGRCLWGRALLRGFSWHFPGDVAVLARCPWCLPEGGCGQLFSLVLPLCLSALSATILSLLQGCLSPVGNVLLASTVQGELLAPNPRMVSPGTSAPRARTAVGIQPWRFHGTELLKHSQGVAANCLGSDHGAKAPNSSPNSFPSSHSGR